MLEPLENPRNFTDMCGVAVKKKVHDQAEIKELAEIQKGARGPAQTRASPTKPSAVRGGRGGKRGGGPAKAAHKRRGRAT